MPQPFPGLTQAQQHQLHDLGYVVAPDLIDHATIDAVRSEIDGVVDQYARQMHDEGMLPESYSDAGFDRQLAKIAQHDIAAARELIARVHGERGEGGHMGPAIFDLIRHPKLLDAMESLVGPEIIGSSVYRIRPKAPGLTKGAVPWHQDSGYLMGHCDREMIITCWIPLVDADIENGCLYVIPEAHKHGILQHHTGGSAGYLVINDEDLPPNAKPIPVPVPKGGVLIMTNLTPHASFMNNSDHVRWSIDLRYQNASVPHNVDVHPGDIDPDGPEIEIACHPPEADFILRSPREPDREVRTWQRLEEIRNDYFADAKDLRVRVNRWKRVDVK